MVSTIRFGFHTSIAGSVANAPKTAAETGCNCFQMFTPNSRSWEHKRVEKPEREEFVRCVKDHDLVAFAHMPYTNKLPGLHM
jgi:deoxyribonuclease-4